MNAAWTEQTVTSFLTALDSTDRMLFATVSERLEHAQHETVITTGIRSAVDDLLRGDPELLHARVRMVTFRPTEFGDGHYFTTRAEVHFHDLPGTDRAPIARKVEVSRLVEEAFNDEFGRVGPNSVLVSFPEQGSACLYADGMIPGVGEWLTDRGETVAA